MPKLNGWGGIGALKVDYASARFQCHGANLKLIFCTRRTHAWRTWRRRRTARAPRTEAHVRLQLFSSREPLLKSASPKARCGAPLTLLPSRDLKIHIALQWIGVTSCHGPPLAARMRPRPTIPSFSACFEFYGATSSSFFVVMMLDCGHFSPEESASIAVCSMCRSWLQSSLDTKRFL